MKLILNLSDEQKIFELKEGENLIGRWDPDTASFPEIDLEDYDEEAKVSRKHAVILVQNETAHLIDLESKNGTYVKGRNEKLESIELENGMELIFGNIILRFET